MAARVIQAGSGSLQVPGNACTTTGAKAIGIVPTDVPGTYGLVEDTPESWADLIERFKVEPPAGDIVRNLGGRAAAINPLMPAELVIDHSVMVDVSARGDALQKNEDIEFERNGERYEFLRWGQEAFDNFRVVPPGTGICHQVNLEYLAQTVWTAKIDGKSLKPLLENPAATWDRPAFTQVWRGSFAGHSVRTERYRYTEWDDGRKGAELYDYQTDPNEFCNLADDPQHASKVAELKALLHEKRERVLGIIVRLATLGPHAD